MSTTSDKVRARPDLVGPFARLPWRAEGLEVFDDSNDLVAVAGDEEMAALLVEMPTLLLALAGEVEALEARQPVACGCAGGGWMGGRLPGTVHCPPDRVPGDALCPRECACGGRGFMRCPRCEGRGAVWQAAGDNRT